MGILGLSKVIADLAPAAIKENELKNYFGLLILNISNIILFVVYANDYYINFNYVECR